MSVLDDLMKRLGFVNLRRYGLVVTAQDRLVSTRSKVLDDDGTPVVGWRDADLAAAELPPWGAPKQPRPHVIEPRISVQMRAIKPSEPVASDEPQTDEDWEWHIAVARARAAAEEADKAAAAVAPKRAPAPATVPGRKDASVTQPIRKKPTTLPPTSAPRLAERMPAARPVAIIPTRAKPASDIVTPSLRPALKIVKPVDDVTRVDVAPTRPTGSKTAPMAVVTTDPTKPTRMATVRAASPDVIAKKTQRMETAEPDIIEEHDAPSPTEATVVGPAPVTARHRAARGTSTPANDDRTDTKVTLPPAAKPVALPSITQRMARR